MAALPEIAALASKDLCLGKIDGRSVEDLSMTLHVKPRPFTVEEYARMGQAGVFRPDERVELIEGEILAMSPQNRPHASRTARLTTLLVRAFGDTHEIRVGLPLTLGEYSEPEPDFAVVSLLEADRAPRHPAGADLVIEVSDASLPFDRAEKASLYAKAGISDYWILNLRGSRLEVRRHPEPDPDSLYGFNYSTVEVYTAGQMVSPLAFPERSFQVSELLGL